VGAQGVNSYAYVRNNPLRLIDPNGLDAIDLEDVEPLDLYAAGDWGEDPGETLATDGALNDAAELPVEQTQPPDDQKLPDGPLNPSLSPAQRAEMEAGIVKTGAAEVRLLTLATLTEWSRGICQVGDNKPFLAPGGARNSGKSAEGPGYDPNVCPAGSKLIGDIHGHIADTWPSHKDKYEFAKDHPDLYYYQVNGKGEIRGFNQWTSWPIK
jgi:hypothetical protein